jgi:phosphatidylserine decarboxylase
MNLNDLFVYSQYITPQHLLSRAAGKVADCEVAGFKNPLINWFIKKYNVNMSEAELQSAQDFKSFNDFFTRQLKADARTIDESADAIISPVDGAISQLGQIQQGQIFQAKGQSFSIVELLGGDAERAQPFMGGNFATIYLAPKDYHRIHMPCAGTLREMVYIPGKLFSVNPVTAENVPRLFARNERVAAIFDTEFGPMVMVLVGAMIVASIETVWSGLVAPIQRNVKSTSYGISNEEIKLEKGAEMGRFKLGSTVVVAFPPNATEFVESLKATSVVRMGQTFGSINK